MFSKIKNPIPVKPFFAVMYVPDFDMDGIRDLFLPAAGPIDDILPPYEFSFTDYYTPEMGKGLKKTFMSFERLIQPDRLADIKHLVTEIEQNTMINGRRRINIDPGYVTAAKVILSTSKDFSHRIYIGKGVYGDVHLQYRNGKFIPNPWTYPDYQSEAVLSFLLGIRSRFMEQLALEK